MLGKEAGNMAEKNVHGFLKVDLLVLHPGTGLCRVRLKI